jgi:hypothetical protein
MNATTRAKIKPAPYLTDPQPDHGGAATARRAAITFMARPRSKREAGPRPIFSTSAISVIAEHGSYLAHIAVIFILWASTNEVPVPVQNLSETTALCWRSMFIDLWHFGYLNEGRCNAANFHQSASGTTLKYRHGHVMIVEHAILSQQCGPSIQQFIENLNVRNSGMLGRQKYELDRPVT